MTIKIIIARESLAVSNMLSSVIKANYRDATIIVNEQIVDWQQLIDEIQPKLIICGTKAQNEEIRLAQKDKIPIILLKEKKQPDLNLRLWSGAFNVLGTLEKPFEFQTLMSELGKIIQASPLPNFAKLPEFEAVDKEIIDLLTTKQPSAVTDPFYDQIESDIDPLKGYEQITASKTATPATQADDSLPIEDIASEMEDQKEPPAPLEQDEPLAASLAENDSTSSANDAADKDFEYPDHATAESDSPELELAKDDDQTSSNEALELKQADINPALETSPKEEPAKETSDLATTEFWPHNEETEKNDENPKLELFDQISSNIKTTTDKTDDEFTALQADDQIDKSPAVDFTLSENESLAQEDSPARSEEANQQTDQLQTPLADDENNLADKQAESNDYADKEDLSDAKTNSSDSFDVAAKLTPDKTEDNQEIGPKELDALEESDEKVGPDGTLDNEPQAELAVAKDHLEQQSNNPITLVASEDQSETEALTSKSNADQQEAAITDEKTAAELSTTSVAAAENIEEKFDREATPIKEQLKETFEYDQINIEPQLATSEFNQSPPAEVAESGNAPEKEPAAEDSDIPGVDLQTIKMSPQDVLNITQSTNAESDSKPEKSVAEVDQAVTTENDQAAPTVVLGKTEIQDHLRRELGLSAINDQELQAKLKEIERHVLISEEHNRISKELLKKIRMPEDNIS